MRKETKTSKMQVQEEKEKSIELIERIQQLEHQNKRLTAENTTLKQFLTGEVKQLELHDSSVIFQARKLLAADYKLSNTNVLSTNLELLETEVKNLNTIHYLAVASVDVKNGKDAYAN